ncbi:MAG: alpha-1,2-fucosyltransferase [Candidatus Gastranaerophilales bacterium]|nr:alpha-1,2-fucosyltransferase [Candidatus Gastranaerophilales bacterium]
MKKQKIIKFQGGLGNQMFQYALGEALKKVGNTEVLFDVSWFKKSQKKAHKKGLGIRYYEMNIFNNINIKFANKWQILCAKALDLLGFCKKYKEKDPFYYDEDIFSDKYNYYSGYFQNENYFKDIKEKLINDFELPMVRSEDEYNKNLINKINSYKNPVFIHVRREDYVNLGYTISLEYYKKAVKYIKKHVENPKFFVFCAEDTTYIQNNFNIDCDFELIGEKNKTRDSFYENMRLMLMCRHGILANSSYSWWGAWLNQNENKIIVAPSPWLNGDDKIIPETWVKIKV